MDKMCNKIKTQHKDDADVQSAFNKSLQRALQRPEVYKDQKRAQGFLQTDLDLIPTLPCAS